MAETDRTSDRLLMLLKTRGNLSTKALAEALGISVPAVRQHLKAQSEFVEMDEQRHRVGRPAQIWRLTPAAQSRFPDTHAELTVRLIESIEHSLGETALNAVIADRMKETLRNYQRRLFGVTSLAGKLKRLVQIRSEEGYMAELVREEGRWLLFENHCPICAAATHCQGFCRNELLLFQTLLGDEVEVERIEYLLEGGERCTYAISGG